MGEILADAALAVKDWTGEVVTSVAPEFVDEVGLDAARELEGAS